MPGVITNSESPTAADHDRITATRETLEDYTLRLAPRSYRRWPPAVVGISALGGIAYLADFAIGANVGITWGTANALCGIAIFALVVFVTGLPLAYYAARYNIDLDLITRGSGFGYYGSVVTNVIFATFTFIFFALEGSIMAQGLKLGLHIPLWAGYACSTLIIFPLVVYGMKVLSQLQLWTTPLWLILMAAPFGYLVVSHPDSIGQFFSYAGKDGHGGLSFGSVLLAAGVCLSLIAQIAEQIDYLRFMPPRTPENANRWWTWTLLAGPGWVAFGATKQIIGLFLAVYLMANIPGSSTIANQPVHQFMQIYRTFVPGWLALTLAVILVVLSQIKINVTNAYSGSLAWTNSFTRLTKHYPGRVVFLGVNLAIALILMEANMFDFLNTILGLLRQLRYGLGGGGGVGHRLQQVSARPVAEDSRIPPRHAIRHQPGRLRVVAAGRGAVDRHLLRRSGCGTAALFTIGGNRHRVGNAAHSGSRDQRQVLPSPHARRYRSAHVRRARQSLGRGVDLPCLPPGFRAARHAGLPDPWCACLFAVLVHGQAGRACASWVSPSAHPG